jgi:hypothetical protein
MQLLWLALHQFCFTLTQHVVASRLTQSEAEAYIGR